MESASDSRKHRPPGKAPGVSPELASLIESGDLTREIIDTAMDGVVVYDTELRYAYWNGFMERLTGQPAEEILGKRAPDVHPFLKQNGIDVLLERTLAGQPTSTYDVPYTQSRTGWSGWISGRTLPLRNKDDQILGVISVIQDITKRKRAEEALLANEQRYRQLFEDNPLPMWVYDLGTLAFLAVNEAAVRHYGYTHEEFHFMTVNDLLAPADVQSPMWEGRSLRGGLDDARLWRHRTKDGKVIDVEMTSQVLTFSGHRAALVLANDVTERRKAEEALRESEAKYRTLIEAADVAIFLVDVETGRILEANRRAETLLGLPRYRIIGLHQNELYPPELGPHKEAAPRRQALLAAGAPREAYVWHRAGRRIPVDIIATSINYGGRRVMQTVFRDITERKRTEEALARRTRQLEVLSRANRHLHTVLEVPVILRTTVSAAMELVEATGGMGGLVQNGRMVFTEYHAGDRTRTVAYAFESGQGVAGYVLASQLAYLSNDPARDPLVLPEIQQSLGLYNLINVPILNRDGGLLGCLEVHNTTGEHPFEESDLTMLEVLASGAAIAIENAQMIEARQRVEARYRRLAENVLDVIWTVDLELRFTDLTPSALTVFGYAPEELIGRPVFDLLAPASAALIRQAMGKGLKPERLARKEPDWFKTVEAEQIRKDGSSLWVEARVRLLFDEHRKPIGFLGVTRDISERRAAQQQLERSLALHAATLESIPDGVLVVDPQGGMAGFNQTFVHMWRIPKAIVESRDDEQALAFVLGQLKDPEGFLAKVKQLYATPNAESHDYIEFKDGRIFERFSKPRRVLDETVGRVWSFRDVTARHEAKALRAARHADKRQKRKKA